MLRSAHGRAAVDAQHLADDPFRVGGKQVGDGRGDVIRVTEARASSAAGRRAVAAPIPLPAPATTTTWSVKRRIIMPYSPLDVLWNVRAPGHGALRSPAPTRHDTVIS
jgi:hypothetical protein